MEPTHKLQDDDALPPSPSVALDGDTFEKGEGPLSPTTATSSEAHYKRRRLRRPRCKLDKDGCLNLQDILLSFNQPISSEQAWALCYQAARSLSCFPRDRYHELLELENILIHKDGTVLFNCTDSGDSQVSEQKAVFSLGIILFKALDFGLDEGEERRLSPDLETLVISMTNCNEDGEERHQETDDEGIERDSGDTEMDVFGSRNNANVSYNENFSSFSSSLESVVQQCTKHIQGTSELADNHYRAVLRALVAEALELTQFLEKVAIERRNHAMLDNARNNHSACRSSQHLDTLDFNDWARFWVQVIGELRRGVKLKKVEANLTKRAGGSSTRGVGKGAEFELTPYEILMDDIRERRYRLRKTPSPSPRLHKDARAVILDFIRSRPPLKKASERKLAPLEKQATLRELLMESIKKPPKPLRPFSGRHISPLEEVPSERSKDVSKGYEVPPARTHRDTTEVYNHATLRQPKKLITVDFDLKLDADEDDDDDDDDVGDFNEEFAAERFEDEDEAANYWQHKEDYCLADGGKRSIERSVAHKDEDEDSANPWKKPGVLRLTRNEYHRFCDTQLESYDLATQCPSRRASARKHAAHGTALINPCCSGGTTSLPHSRPQSRQHTLATASQNLSPAGPSPNLSLNPSPSLSPQPKARLLSKAASESRPDGVSPNAPDGEDESGQKASLEDMLLDERLSLTLEEIVHIRSVLTKAELESLPVEGRVKEDVEKRRVCFLCLKTRFGILGPWGQRCRLCERTVCMKCYSKMRIPTEHFAHVPVVLLSPGLLLSPTSENEGSKTSWFRSGGAVGSAPASPASRRRDSSMRTPASTPTPVTEPTTASNTPSHSRRHLDDHGEPEKRSYKNSGSPAKLSSTSTFGGGVLSSEQRLAAERLRGVAMVVCHDCRIMVIQIIKSSRSTRATIRNNVISRLTLNLSPAYV